MRVLIIGGAGFIGSYLKDVGMNGGCTVMLADKLLMGGEYVDVRDYDTFAQLPQCDVIVNLAAEHRDDVNPISEYYRVNVDGAKNVCRFAEERGVTKIIFTSSVAIYGMTKEGEELNEASSANPFNDYGRSKLAAEEVYKQWQEKCPELRQIIIIRPTVVFGPGNRGNVYRLMKAINSKLYIRIGSGENIKSIAYVENLAQFIFFLMYSKHNLKVYNYVDKPDLKLNELEDLIAANLGVNIPKLKLPVFLALGIGFFCSCVTKITSVPLPISYIRVKKLVSSSRYASRAFEEGEFAPEYSLESALEKAIKAEFFG